MQFSCESCKITLQIADEKVRGKRLVVRCKRCGSKISISDPALADRASPRLAAPATQTSAPPRPAASRPAPAGSRPGAAPKKRDTDTESTRATDSDLLEKALEASKRDASASVALASRDPPIWFAMLGGKQTGPLTRAELGTKAAEGAVSPRTYLWKDGMASWQRVMDMPELSAMFAPPPGPPRPAASPPVALPTRGFREFSAADFGNGELGGQNPVEKPHVEGQHTRLAPPIAERKPDAPAPVQAGGHDGEDRTTDLLRPGERVHQDGVAKGLVHAGNSETAGRSALDPARWASDQLQSKPTAQPRQQPMFASAAPTRGNRGPLVVAIALGILAALAVLLWFFVGPASELPADETAAVQKPAAQAPAAPRAEAQRPEKKPPAEKPAPAADPVAPAAAPIAPAAAPVAAQTSGLTADQVRRKLQENKGALQSCIDQALRADPNLKVGRIHITTSIAPTGRVTAAKIDKRAVDGSPLGSCLKRATRRIVFPSFTGDPFDVQIPIVVTAGE